MKRQSLEILYRHRKHLLEKEQIVLQDKIAEENQQKLRLLHLQERIQRRAVSLSGQSRQEAVERTLKTKQSLDQIGLLLEKQHSEHLAEIDASERRQLDELVTSRYAMALRGV
jgi:hypothetical protein